MHMSQNGQTHFKKSSDHFGTLLGPLTILGRKVTEPDF